MSPHGWFFVGIMLACVLVLIPEIGLLVHVSHQIGHALDTYQVQP